MSKGIKTIVKNDTWELASLFKGYEVIRVKWMYKVKKISNIKGE